ncbi:hypothetical protein GIB67_005675 [Kingdonia uniflora]|uniref:Uncharacterized protein n=1 Tax=Kingdonia uniflora TaxID=39325 RepID=A0A7J7NHU1_9MAGN|nr:hypothetical protein GIB67_005675 [Kingdonia uniflora]
MIAVLLPVREVLVVIFYHKDLNFKKSASLALSLWGFISYFYGEFKQSKKINQTQNTESHGSTSTV